MPINTIKRKAFFESQNENNEYRKKIKKLMIS